MRLRPLAPEDDGWALALNAASAPDVWLVSGERFARLRETAFAALAAGERDGFAIAFDQDADYDSPNFLWFKARHARFVYVDRIAVAPERRRSGVARALYAEILARAAAVGAAVCCEVNATPPNPVSDAFHAALGFSPVGEGAFEGGAKRVRYLMRQAAAEDAA
jgi:predicted GNAT superfamily acetyltransferase